LPSPPDQRRGLLLAGRPAGLGPGIPGAVTLPQPDRRTVRHRRQRAGTTGDRRRRGGRGHRRARPPRCAGTPGWNDMTEPVPRIIAGDTIGPVDATAVPRYG